MTITTNSIFIFTNSISCDLKIYISINKFFFKLNQQLKQAVKITQNLFLLFAIIKSKKI